MPDGPPYLVYEYNVKRNRTYARGDGRGASWPRLERTRLLRPDVEQGVDHRFGELTTPAGTGDPVKAFRNTIALALILTRLDGEDKQVLDRLIPPPSVLSGQLQLRVTEPERAPARVILQVPLMLNRAGGDGLIKCDADADYFTLLGAQRVVAVKAIETVLTSGAVRQRRETIGDLARRRPFQPDVPVPVLVELLSPHDASE
jgi:hypothetical protein